MLARPPGKLAGNVLILNEQHSHEGWEKPVSVDICRQEHLQ